jgi:hypothetical protein
MTPAAGRDDAVLDLLVEALPHLRGGERAPYQDSALSSLRATLQLALARLSP